MRIGFIGKFSKLHDEEYIARSFESLGHQVDRISDSSINDVDLSNYLKLQKPDVLLYTKYLISEYILNLTKITGTKTVCWLFDLYFDYHREFRVKRDSYFRSQFVFTTDGGHDDKWLDLGVNHKCVRQGIYADECYMLAPTPDIEVAFVGSDSPVYPERTATMNRLAKEYDFRWFGKRNTDELRGGHLNILFSRTKVIVGDSYFSPHYWSNRVVETLGRGGFLIHREVPGLKEEYPHLVTYDGSFEDLKGKIDLYLKDEKTRLDIVRRNYEWVKDRYTMDKKCQELLNYIS